MGKNDKETFEDFVKSFFYGARSDLSFKFMSDLSENEASLFIQALFKDIVDAIDDNDLSKIKMRLVKGQVQGYSEQKNFDYDDGPFHRPKKSLSEMKLSLLTSSGHFLKVDDPKPLGVDNMTQAEAEHRIFDFLKEAPQLSPVPFDTDPELVAVRHGGYDVRAAIKDPNVSFPYEIMKRLWEKGLFKTMSNHAYSFVGACSQKRLLKKTLPDWVEQFAAQEIDAVLLVPV